MVVLLLGVRGPSPRVRGSRMRPGVLYAVAGSIPACAGEPLPPGGTHDPLAVHPRVCGGAHEGFPGRTPAWGPSPRVRGSQSQRVTHIPAFGSIPACAGEPRGWWRRRARERVHPRVCGGANQVFHAPPGCMGPSPRVRGSLAGGALVVLALGSIPACAGEPLRGMLHFSMWRVHPRVCGGALYEADARQLGQGPSPRVRGSQPGG